MKKSLQSSAHSDHFQVTSWCIYFFVKMSFKNVYKLYEPALNYELGLATCGHIFNEENQYWKTVNLAKQVRLNRIDPEIWKLHEYLCNVNIFWIYFYEQIQILMLVVHLYHLHPQCNLFFRTQLKKWITWFKFTFEKTLKNCQNGRINTNGRIWSRLVSAMLKCNVAALTRGDWYLVLDSGAFPVICTLSVCVERPQVENGYSYTNIYETFVRVKKTTIYCIIQQVNTFTNIFKTDKVQPLKTQPH